eukprot:3910298-Amphidinium_carterae.1
MTCALKCSKVYTSGTMNYRMLVQSSDSEAAHIKQRECEQIVFRFTSVVTSEFVCRRNPTAQCWARMVAWWNSASTLKLATTMSLKTPQRGKHEAWLLPNSLKTKRRDKGDKPDLVHDQFVVACDLPFLSRQIEKIVHRLHGKSWPTAKCAGQAVRCSKENMTVVRRSMFRPIPIPRLSFKTASPKQANGIVHLSDLWTYSDVHPALVDLCGATPFPKGGSMAKLSLMRWPHSTSPHQRTHIVFKCTRLRL